MKSIMVHISSLVPDPENPRTTMSGIDELAQTIRDHGLLQPLLVQPLPPEYGGRSSLTTTRYLIVAGHRRYYGCKKARLDMVQVMVQSAELSKDKLLLLRLVENCHEPMGPIDEAKAYGLLRDRGLAQSQIASSVGRTPFFVSARLSLLELDEESQKRVAEGLISATEAMYAVRSVRVSTGRGARDRKPIAMPDHFRVHPLSATARTRCMAAGHVTSRKVQRSGACGACWEEVIRQDERDHAGRRNTANGNARTIDLRGPVHNVTVT
jgi:ParB/RepB/Spo0J family partition protein